MRGTKERIKKRERRRDGVEGEDRDDRKQMNVRREEGKRSMKG